MNIQKILLYIPYVFMKLMCIVMRCVNCATQRGVHNKKINRETLCNAYF